MNFCTLTVPNALFMSNVNVVVCGGCIWLKLIALVLYKVCDAVSMIYLFLQPSYVVMHTMML